METGVELTWVSRAVHDGAASGGQAASSLPPREVGQSRPRPTTYEFSPPGCGGLFLQCALAVAGLTPQPRSPDPSCCHCYHCHLQPLSMFEEICSQVPAGGWRSHKDFTEAATIWGESYKTPRMPTDGGEKYVPGGEGSLAELLPHLRTRSLASQFLTSSCPLPGPNRGWLIRGPPGWPFWPSTLFSSPHPPPSLAWLAAPLLSLSHSLLLPPPGSPQPSG